MKEELRTQEVKAALARLLGEVPFVRLESVTTPAAKNGGPDLLAKVRCGRRRVNLALEVAANGQPRAARQVLENWGWRQRKDTKTYLVFAAPYVGPEAAALLKNADAGYLDLSGNGRLTFGQVFIQVSGHPNRFAVRRDLRSLFSPKAARVLRVFLADPSRAWKTVPLAEEARVSMGQVANVKRLLADREWLKSTEQGIQLTQPEALLTEWAGSQEFRLERRWELYALAPMEIEAKLTEICRRKDAPYALSSFSAALRYAPMVRSQRLSAYVPGGLEPFFKDLGLKEVASGANVALIEPGEDGVFYGARAVDGIQVASAVQTFLDLKRERGRGDEAAQAILEQILRPAWL